MDCKSDGRLIQHTKSQLMKKLLPITLLLMLFSFVSMAQLSLSKEKHDFGTTQLNIPLAYEFQYINYSANTINIDFIKTTCACLKIKWNKSTLEPGEVGQLIVTYLPIKNGGYKEMVEIYLADNPYPETVTIIGVIGEENIYHEPSLSNAKPVDSNPSLISPIPTPNEQMILGENEPSPTIQKEKIKILDRPRPSRVTKPSKTQSAPVKPVPNRSTATTLSPATVTSTVSYLSTDIAKNYLGDATLNTALNESYLSNREKAMIKEINLVRSNPQAYIQVVKAYIQYMKVKDKEWYNEEISVAKELILELEKTPKLSILLPSKEIYMAAKAHGTAAKKIGSLEHEGQDGSLPWDRVVKYDKTMRDGNENIVGGMNDIRKSVLTLLIDSGIEGRGHRKTMLKKEWTHVAAHEVGKVGEIPYMWLQMFGQAKSNTSTIISLQPESPVEHEVATTPVKPNRFISKPLKNNTETLVSVDSPSKPNGTASVDMPMISTNNLASDILPPKNCYTAEEAVYLRNSEKEMIAEINFLRTQPQAYIKVLEAYIEFMDSEISKDNSARIFYDKELKSANDLIELLKRLPPLSALRPNKGMYKAAKIHGDYGQASGNLEKQSSDGAMPHNRIMKYATEMMDGDENLPYGSDNVRYSIIKLLIDKDDVTRTQRKILLNPKWDYIAVYEVGKVGNMHYWVQDFGQARPEYKQRQDIGEVETSTPVMTSANVEYLTPTIIAPQVQPPAAVYDNNYSTFLSKEEQILLREVNFVRSNPTQYAQIMEAYIDKLQEAKEAFPQKVDYYTERIEAAKFVQEELAKASSVAILKPNENLYKAAYQHGQDCKISGKWMHLGTDGSNTWDRLQRNAPTIKDGDQCLVGNSDDIRESVISILIDHVIYRHNRENILMRREWTDFAASEVGKVGKRTDCWVITFGMF